MRRLRLLLACLTPWASGCGFEPDAVPAVPGTDGVFATLDAGDAAGDDAEREADAGPPTVLFAGSELELYRVDPVTLDATLVGAFDGLNITGLAMSPGGVLYGVSTASRLYRIDQTNADCTMIGQMDIADSYWGLTFTPGGLIAGSADGDVVRVDLETAAITPIGTYSADGTLGTAGDIAFVPGMGMIASLRKSDASNDWLGVVDPTTGRVTSSIDSGLYGMWGLTDCGSGTLCAFRGGTAIARLDAATGASLGSVPSTISWSDATTLR